MDKEKLIKMLIKEEGGSREDYLNLLNRIAYHESAGTMDPTIKQIGGGPGRGKYQFEEGKHQGGITAAKRLKQYFKKNNIVVPKWLDNVTKNDSLDVSTLDEDKQDMLFLGNMKMHPKADLEKVFKGDQSIEDLWVNYHWAGPATQKRDRLKSFRESNKSYNNSDYFNNIKNINEAKSNQVTPMNQMKSQQVVQKDNIPQVPQMRFSQSDNTPEALKNNLQAILNRVNEQSNQSVQPDRELNYFATGGTHEQSPIGGIPQGSTNGNTNLVEEGETSFNLPDGKFIFSDRINLDPSKNKSYIKNNNTFPDGGKINPLNGSQTDPSLKEINKMSFGDRYVVNDENIEESRNRVINYLNSPGFLRIAKNNKYEDPEKLRQERLNIAKNINVDVTPSIGKKPGYIDGVYSKEKNKVMVEPFISKGIVEHEINHATTDGLNNLNDFTKSETAKRVSDNIMNYYNSPEEVQTRVVNSRLLLEHSDIWDYNKGDFTKEHLKKLKKDLKENPNRYRVQDFIDLIDHVNSDEDFIWLMNNIASTNNNIDKYKGLA